MPTNMMAPCSIDAVQMRTLHPPADIRANQFSRVAYETILGKQWLSDNRAFGELHAIYQADVASESRTTLRAPSGSLEID